MKKFIVALLLSAAFICSQIAFADPPKAETNEQITEVSFRQACLCSDWVDITLKADSPLTAPYLGLVSRWLETQHIFDLKDKYFFQDHTTECNQTFTIVRGGQKKVIAADCAAVPPELWALEMIMRRIIDEIKQSQRREELEKQGVRGKFQNYIAEKNPMDERSVNAMVWFEPEPYQPGLQARGTQITENTTWHFHAPLMPGTYRMILDVQSRTPSRIPLELIKVEANKFTELEIDYSKVVSPVKR